MNNRLIATLCVSLSLTGLRAQCVEPLPDDAWQQSQWISVKDAPVVEGRVNDHTPAAPGANWFVCTFQNERRIASARWMTTGLGVYDLYVNGHRVGEEVLKPGFTHCLRTKRSFTYDVTRHLQRKAGSANRLAVEVTPGWWADNIVTPGGSQGMYGTRCAFRGVLCLTFDDGSTRLLGTDTLHWQAAIAGPVVQSSIFDGETYDARRPSPAAAQSSASASGQGSSALGQSSAFKAADLNSEFRGSILPNNGAEVYLRHDLSLAPVRAYIYNKVEETTEKAYGKVVVEREYPKGRNIVLHPGEHLVVDFGQNAAAVPSFVFQAAEGTVLTCLPGELLNDGGGDKSRGMDGPEGSVHRRNLRIHDHGVRLSYTFARSAKPVEYMPRHTFFGYRYLDITATADVRIVSMQSVPVSSITKAMEIGQLTTGNDLINKLISNTIWGQRSNYLSVPTDCPQRNERLGWTADTQVFAATGSFFANTDRFFHKWLQDLRDTQSPEGGYPGVAPFAQYGAAGNEMMRVGWADAGIIVPWTIWKQYGDASIVDESWASMERFMQHLADTKYDHTALIRENGDYQWADWLSYEPFESCGGDAFRPGNKADALNYWNFLSASYWMMDALMMRDMALATGRDAQRYQAMADTARQYIRQQFLDDELFFKTRRLNLMQTPALFLLRNGILEGEAKARCIDLLRKNFQRHDGCLQTGFLGTSILMSTLTDNGMADLAYDLLFQRKNPSWLYSVDNGATTIWERWNSYTYESGMGPSGMNSFNHYAYGCVCQWLWETAAGIASDPASPGFSHIIMRPVPDRRLGHLDATYHSSAGLIRSSWHYKGNTWVWTFTIPQGATATVTLPGSATDTLPGSATDALPGSSIDALPGSATDALPGSSIDALPGSATSKEYGPGTHTLTVEL